MGDTNFEEGDNLTKSVADLKDDSVVLAQLVVDQPVTFYLACVSTLGICMYVRIRSYFVI